MERKIASGILHVPIYKFNNDKMLYTIYPGCFFSCVPKFAKMGKIYINNFNLHQSFFLRFL